MRTIRTRMDKLKVVAAIALAFIFSSDARAQDSSARVTGCLDSAGDLRGFAFGDAPLRGCAAGQRELALALDDLSEAARLEPFFVTLRLGEEQLIAAIGALELRARCTLGTTTGGDTLQLLLTSSLDGWFATAAGASTARPLLAGEEIVLASARAQPGEGRLSGFEGGQLVGAQLALAPDGAFLALATGSTALGVHLLDQDCLVVGAATLIQGDLPPPRAIGREIGAAPRQVSGDEQAGGDPVADTPSQLSRSGSDDGAQPARGIGAN